MDQEYPFVPYEGLKFAEDESLSRSGEFYSFMNLRRSVREFSEKPVSRELMHNLVRTAGTAPSGAHKQPWTFCLISDPAIKKQIREAAEKEEFESYHGRMTEEWLSDLKPIGTDWQKPFLETAPWLVVIFKKSYDLDPQGQQHKNYYVNESVGIAAGFFIAAVHQAGLVTLTHTPSPMDFLTRLLSRPANEKPVLLLPVGYPAANATVPDFRRKPLSEILVEF